MLNNFKMMCSFLIDQLLHSLQSLGSKARDKIATNVTCQLEYSGFGYDNEHVFEKELNFNIKVNVDESDFEKSSRIITDNILSRRNSLPLRTDHPEADDTFENILQVTSHHDAVMAFYYRDDYNKVKVTEIFDVTDSSELHLNDINIDIADDHLPSTSKENELKSLADDTSITDTSIDEEWSDNINIFSDPESEWLGNVSKEIKVRRVSVLTHLKPECEQLVNEVTDS